MICEVLKLFYYSFNLKLNSSYIDILDFFFCLLNELPFYFGFDALQVGLIIL